MTVVNASAVSCAPSHGTVSPFIKIRAATPADAHKLASIGRTVFTNSFGHSMPREYLAQYLIDNYSLRNIGKDLRSQDTEVIVALETRDTVQEQILGFAQLTRGTTEPCLASRSNFCQLQRLYVDENQQGKGVGSALMRDIERMAREQGFSGMWLGVLEDNFAAQRLYSRWGFEKVGTHEFFMEEGMVQTDWIMWREL